MKSAKRPETKHRSVEDVFNLWGVKSVWVQMLDPYLVTVEHQATSSREELAPLFFAAAGEIPTQTPKTQGIPMERKYASLKLARYERQGDGKAYEIVLAQDAKAGDILPAFAIGENQLPFRGTRTQVSTAVFVEIPEELRK